MIEIPDKETRDKVEDFDSFLSDLEIQLRDGEITRVGVISKVSDYLKSGKLSGIKLKIKGSK